MEGCRFGLIAAFRLLTGLAGSYVGFNILLHFWPPELL